MLYFIDNIKKKKHSYQTKPVCIDRVLVEIRPSEETLLKRKVHWKCMFPQGVREAATRENSLYPVRMILPEQHLTLHGGVTMVTAENTFYGRSAVSITFALGVALYITIMGTCRICSTATPTSRSSLAKQQSFTQKCNS